MQGHDLKVTSVAVAVDRRIAVSVSDDKTLKVWNLGTGEIEHILQGHTLEVSHVALTVDGQTAVSLSRDGTIRVWDITTGQIRHVLWGVYTEVIPQMALTSDGQSIISWSTCAYWKLEI